MNSLPLNTLFVTGTDTSVGKTYFSAMFLEFLKRSSVKAGYQKWIATGTEADLPEDLSACLEAAGADTNPELLSQQVPYSFRFPASPHLAAEMEDSEIDPEKITESYRTMAAGYDLLVVEGVGGLMVPLRRDLLLADLLQQLKPRTLVVARSGLGTLSHTLLTLEALRRREIPVLGVVFSDPEIGEDERLVQDNMRTISEVGLVRVFGRLARHTDHGRARAEFTPVGQAILEQLLPV